MGVLLDAVRAKNPNITEEQVAFVVGVESAIEERSKKEKEDYAKVVQ